MSNKITKSKVLTMAASISLLIMSKVVLCSYGLEIPDFANTPDYANVPVSFGGFDFLKSSSFKQKVHKIKMDQQVAVRINNKREDIKDSRLVKEITQISATQNFDSKASYIAHIMPETITSIFLAYGTSVITYKELIQELNEGVKRAKKHVKKTSKLSGRDANAAKIMRSLWLQLWEDSIVRINEGYEITKGNDVKLKEFAVNYASILMSIFHGTKNIEQKVRESEYRISSDE